MNKKDSKQKLDKLLKVAKELDLDAFEMSRKRNRVLSLIAVISLLIALMAVVAVASLTPLKTTEPYVIAHETSTGRVEVKRPLKEGGVEQSEALNKFWIVKYLNCFEQYDFQDFKECEDLVKAFSNKKVWDLFFSENVTSNPESPITKLYDKGDIKIEISSINFLDKDTATIRFKKKVRYQESIKPSYWIVTLSFKYTNEPLTESERWINPLGFIVTSYRRDPEVIN